MKEKWEKYFIEHGYNIDEVEKTRKEIFKLLDEEFYPYLMEWDITDCFMFLVMTLLKGGRTLKEIVDVWHETKKKAYHERKGTKPTEYNKYFFADDWQDGPID